jgi:hypothetical protein
LSRASTSVVFPWSTCAMMHTLRRSGRAEWCGIWSSGSPGTTKEPYPAHGRIGRYSQYIRHLLIAHGPEHRDTVWQSYACDCAGPHAAKPLLQHRHVRGVEQCPQGTMLAGRANCTDCVRKVTLRRRTGTPAATPGHCSARRFPIAARDRQSQGASCRGAPYDGMGACLDIAQDATMAGHGTRWRWPTNEAV